MKLVLQIVKRGFIGAISYFTVRNVLGISHMMHFVTIYAYVGTYTHMYVCLLVYHKSVLLFNCETSKILSPKFQHFRSVT